MVSSGIRPGAGDGAKNPLLRKGALPHLRPSPWRLVVLSLGVILLVLAAFALVLD